MALPPVTLPAQLAFDDAHDDDDTALYEVRADGEDAALDAAEAAREADIESGNATLGKHENAAEQ